MPKIPQYFSRGHATSERGPRVSPEAMTAGLEGARRFTNTVLKGAIGLTDTLAEARRKSELSRVKNAWRAGTNDFLLNLDGDTDYDSYADRYEEFQGKLQDTLRSGYKGDIRDFDDFVERENLITRFKIRRRANRGMIADMKGQYYSDLFEATTRGDRDFIEDSTETAIEAGYLDPTEGEKALKAARDKIEYNEAWRNMMASESREEALDVISKAPITASQKNSLVESYDREEKHRKAQQKLKHEMEMAAVHDDFISRAYDLTNPLTHAEVDQANINPVGTGGKAFFHALIESRDDAVLRDEQRPYSTSDPAVLAKVMVRSADPKAPPMTSTEIVDLMGKGLSWDHTRLFLKTMDVRNTDVFKNTEAFLKTQFGYEGILKGFGAAPIGAAYYNNAMTEILSDLAENPVRGDKLRDRMYEISQPYLEDYFREAHIGTKQTRRTLELMGLTPSPALQILHQNGDEKEFDMEYVPGKGWVK